MASSYNTFLVDTPAYQEDPNPVPAKPKTSRWLVLSILVLTVVLLVRSYPRTFPQTRISNASEQRTDNTQQRHTKKTVFLHFPDMVKPNEYEQEIFGDWKDLTADENGFYERNVHVTGANGHFLKVNYRGRYQSDVYLHGLELHDDLDKFGCTEQAMVLQFSTKDKADRVVRDLSAALSSQKYKKVIISGRQIERCPKSKEPEELLNAHLFNDDLEVQQTRISQSLRRLVSVKKMGDDERHVRLDTSFANLQDVFEDLEFSGETDMIERESDMRRQKYPNLRRDNVDGLLAQEQEAFEKENYPSVRMSSVWKESKVERRRSLGWFKKLVTWVVNKVVKPIVNLIKRGVKEIIGFVKSVVGTMIQPMVKLLGSLIPVLVNKKGAHPLGRSLSINYNSHTGHAHRVWEIDTKGLEIGGGFSAGETDVLILAKGRAVCRDCWIRFYDGTFSWRLVIGGRHLAMVELKMAIGVESRIELDASVQLTTQVTHEGPSLPIPGIAIPLGFVTLGFALQPEVTIGVEIEMNGFYVNYHMQGVQTFGLRASLLGGVEKIREGKMTEKVVGPVVKDGATVSVYLTPQCSVIFTNVAALEAGLQPTLSFALKPQSSVASTCKLGWSIEFDVPIVVGGWIGLKTAFGTFRLAGFNQKFSILPAIPIKSGCVTPSDYAKIVQISGVRFGGSSAALSAAGTRGITKIQAAEQNFQKKSSEMGGLYKPQKEFVDHAEKWIESPGNQGCPSVCSSKKLAAVSPEQNRKAFVCSGNANGHGYHPGFNTAGTTRCSVASKTGVKTFDRQFYCLCVPKNRENDVAWEDGRGFNCRVACESKGKYPLASGSYEVSGKPAGVFYPCTVKSKSDYLIGMNIGPRDKEYEYQCGVIKNWRVEKSLAYSCACMTPRQGLEPQISWVATSGEVGCPETCDQVGFFGVVTSTRGNTANYVCGFTVGKTHLEGWSAVNEKGEYSNCHAQLNYRLYKISGAQNFRCLCSKSPSDFIKWIPSYTAPCSATCKFEKMFPVYSYDTTDESICKTKMGTAGTITKHGRKCESFMTPPSMDMTYYCACTPIKMRASAQLIQNGVTKDISYQEDDPMVNSNGVRSAPRIVHYKGRTLSCGVDATMIAVISGLEIKVGPNARFEVEGQPISDSSAQVKTKTWSNSVVLLSRMGYIASCMPNQKLALGRVSTDPQTVNFRNTQTRTMDFKMACSNPKIFAALDKMDVPDTNGNTLRIQLDSTASKKSADTVSGTVAFKTWSGSRIWAAGASMAVYCPVGNLAAEYFQSGVVGFDWRQAAPMNSGRDEQRSKSFSVSFSTTMACSSPQITVGITMMDMRHGRNYRLDLEVTEANLNGFKLTFVTWSNTIIYGAYASYFAVCAQSVGGAPLMKPPDNYVTSGTFYIVQLESGNAMKIVYGSSVLLRTLDKSNEERFELTPTSSGSTYVFVKAVAKPGMYLSVRDRDDQLVLKSVDRQSYNFQFLFEKLSGYVKINSRQTGKTLGTTFPANNVVKAFGYFGGNNQQFRLVPV